MIKEKYEIKEHIVRDRVCVGKNLFCDICKSEIKKGNGYWNVHTWHNDWGNDSVESHVHFDVCSVKCLMDKFNEYGTMSNDDRNSMELHVMHDTWYPKENME